MAQKGQPILPDRTMEGNMEQPSKTQAEERMLININNLRVCICKDGEICLFKKERIFDILYSAWVEVYYEIDYEGKNKDRIAIMGKKGDKVFPVDEWLEPGEFIIERDTESPIVANCVIGKVVKGSQIFQAMRKNTGGEYCKTSILSNGDLTHGDLAKMLKSADRYFRFEKPEPSKQKIKK